MRSIRSRGSLAAQHVVNIVADLIGNDAKLRATKPVSTTRTPHGAKRRRGRFPCGIRSARRNSAKGCTTKETAHAQATVSDVDA
jgi:hypothetical protein